jgi:hypothetical protein
LVLFFRKELLLNVPAARTVRADDILGDMRVGRVLLIILIVLLFGGGFGSTYRGWGGDRYRHYGRGGIGLGTILLIVLIVLLLQGP